MCHGPSGRIGRMTLAGWTAWISGGGRAGLSPSAGLRGRAGRAVGIFTAMTGFGRTSIGRAAMGAVIFTVTTGGRHTWIGLARAESRTIERDAPTFPGHLTGSSILPDVIAVD